MDHGLALARLDQLIYDIDAYDVAVNGIYFGTANDETIAEVDTRILEGVSIAQRFAGTHVKSLEPIYQLPGSEGRWRQTKQTARKLRAEIATSAEVARIMGPTGPSMSATSLHPAIWNAALNLWGNGHYREAVQAAAVALDLMTSAKTGTSLTGKDLFQEAFSEHSPKPGRPRLRFNEVVGDKPRWVNQHEGTRNLSVGAMQLIRNETTHSLTSLDPSIAFEYLAVLSVVARQVDEATLVKSGDVELSP